MELIALLFALALVGLNAFFVATEFAIVKVRATRIEELQRKGRPGAATVRHIIGNLDGYLSATQLGITLTSLGLGWIGEPAFARVIEGPLAAMNVTDPVWVHRITLGTAFAIITVLHIVLGELAPKSLAIIKSETVALAVAYPMRAFHLLFFPAIWALNGLANLVLRALRISATSSGGDQHSEEEIRIILSQARSAGLLRPSRAELLSKALTLPSKTVRHLMVPRNDVFILDANQTFEANLERAMTAGHTRFPLCDRELDEVIGVVDIRRALFQCHGGASVDLRLLASSPLYVPETMSAERLLSELRSHKTTMAIVVDEYGGASGIVTAADVVTSVMGGIEDNDQSDVIPLPGGIFEVEGVVPLEEVSEALRITLSSETAHTLAGFLIEHLGRLPRPGDRVLTQGYQFNVVDVVGPRVHKVRIQRDTGSEIRPTTKPEVSPVPRPAEHSRPHAVGDGQTAPSSQPRRIG